MTAQTTTVYAPKGVGASQDVPAEISKCLVYIGLPDNPQFLGPQDPQELAERIVRSRGPSGENKVISFLGPSWDWVAKVSQDYLYQLETALNDLSEESGDEHISDLARRCREIEEVYKRDGRAIVYVQDEIEGGNEPWKG